MYLSNTELKKILPEMNITGTDESHPFNADKQIQLCSIDLRISNIFWRQRKVYRSVDLGNRKVHELAPRREWKKVEIGFKESIILKPGELLLGRTYENFKIPKEYAGKIVAKSSIARLGISIFCSTDFINPGWYGHCPLVLKNNGIHSIKIYPLLSMCQVMVVTLTSLPEGEFGEGKYISSYQNDDGGPSFWWRDQVFQAIEDIFQGHLSDDILDQLIAKFQKMDDEGIHRFKTFSSKIKTQELGNATDIISAFTLKEKRNLKFQRVLKGVLGMLQIALVGTSVKLLLDTIYTNMHLIFWGTTLLSLPFTIWYVFYRDEIKYYSEIEF